MFFCKNISKWRMVAALVAAEIALATGIAEAQGPVDAGVRGRLFSTGGVSLGGIEIAVQDSKGTMQKTVSAKDGTFLLLRLAPGEYVVSAQGSSEEVELHAGKLYDLLLRTSGNVQPPISYAPVPPDQAYSFAAITQLPLAGNAWESLERADSTANSSVNDAAQSGEQNAQDSNALSTEENVRANDGQSASGASSAGISVNGDSTTVDGLSARQNFGAGPRGVTPGGVHAGATFGEYTVREFRTLPRTFSAQYGGAGGGVSVVLQGAEHDRPGEWHGAAFFEMRQSAWAAVNPFSVVTHYHDGVVTNSLAKPQNSRRQFGGQVGWSLPLKFLPPRLRRGVNVLASLEEQTSEETIESTPQLANFYQLTAGQTDLLMNRGLKASQINAALDYLDSLSGAIAETAVRTLGFARLNLQPAERDHVTLGYIHSQFEAPASVALGQASGAVFARGRGSIGANALQIDAGTARWLHQFSSRWNHELRAQIARDLEFETPRAPLPQEPAIAPGGYAPQVTIGPQGFAYGTPSNLGRVAYPDEGRIELASLTQIALHGHLLSAGAEWSRITDRIASFTNADGSFAYDGPSVSNGVSESGLVNWISDYVYNVNVNPTAACPHVPFYPADRTTHYFCFHAFTQNFGPVQTKFVTHDFAGFAEDAFHLGKDMTVTLGARYEYTLFPLPQTPNYALDTALVSALGANAPATDKFPEDRNNIGPRIAIAWAPRWSSPTPFLTVHAGYGIFFGKLAGATVRQALIDTAMPSTTLNIRIRPTTTTVCPQMPNEGFGYPCTYVTTPPAAVQQTTQAIAFAKNFRVPLVQRATFEVEHSVGRHFLLRSFYSMAIATQLSKSVDVNIAPSPASLQFIVQGGGGQPGIVNGQTFRLPLYTARLLPQYGPVTEIESNANATYHAGTLEVRWRSANLEARGGYTFSRAIDYAPMTGAVPQTNGQLDPFTTGYDKGLSGLNFPQRFAGDLIYKVKIERGPKDLRAVLSGIRISAIARAGSGAPYSYGIYGGSYLSGGSDSINGSGGATYLPTVGRNTLRLPARSNVDARISRAFRVGDRVHGEGFVEAFNLLNTVQLTRVETRAFLVGTPTVTNSVTGPTPLIFQDATSVATAGISTPAFGMPLSSTGGGNRERELELGVRVQF